MFDSAPDNLPVAPQDQASAPAAPPTAPAGQGTPIIISSAAKREPEDMFAGVADVPGTAPRPVAEAAPTIAFEAPPEHRGIKIALAVVLGIAIVGGLGVAAYYFFVLRPAAEQEAALEAGVPTDGAAVAPAGSEIPIPTPGDPPPSLAGETAPAADGAAVAPGEASPLPTGTVPAPGEAAPPPNIPPPEPVPGTPPVVSEGEDGDRDGLTDAEEALYASSPTAIDTDADQFGDANEVRNGFDPAVKGKPLSASAQMRTERWQVWDILFPKTWSIVPEAGNPYRASIDTGTPARIQLRSEANGQRQSIEAWVAARGLGDRARAFALPGGRTAMQTQDGLTTYLPFGDRVLVVVYDPQSATAYEFRATYALLLATIKDVRP